MAKLNRAYETLSLKDMDESRRKIAKLIDEDFDSWLERYLSQEETIEVRVFEYVTDLLIAPEMPTITLIEERTFEYVTEFLITPEMPTTRTVTPAPQIISLKRLPEKMNAEQQIAPALGDHSPESSGSFSS